MTGLRDRKKREIRNRMIEVAGRLFAERGLDETTIEEIAAAADVSVGTVYNYFGSKNALLLAVVESDTDEMIALGATVLDDPGPDAVAAVQRLLSAYTEHFASWDTRLLREVLSAAFQRVGGEELTGELVAMDRRLIEQLTILLSRLQANGALHRDVEVPEATLLLFSTFVTQLFMYLSVEGASAAELRAQLDRQIELAFSGLGTNKKAKKR